FAQPGREVVQHVVGEVGGVAHPGEHADLVVELHGDDVAAVRLEARGDYRHDGLVPVARFLEEGGREVIEGPGRDRFAVPGYGDNLRVLGVQPIGQPLVLHLGHDERAGAGEEVEVVLLAQVDEAAQVELGPGL